MKLKKLSRSMKKLLAHRPNPVYLHMFLFIILMMGLIYGLYLFFGGFHNIDLAQNIRYINAEFNLTIGDKASDYNVYTWENLFIMGSNMLYKGLFISLICVFNLGIILSDFLNAMAILDRIRKRRSRRKRR